MDPILIYFENKEILICEKPAGISSEDGGLPDILCKQTGITKLYVVHRLDKDVTGGILYAKTKEAASKISAQIVSGAFRKTYIAAAEGIPDEKEGEFSDLLFYDRKQGKSYVVDKERRGVKRALMRYKVLDTFLSDNDKDSSIIELELMSGRTHQIRVQLASRGYPILGDRRYGSKEPLKGIELRSYKMKLSDPSTGEELSFLFPLPNEYPWNKV